MKFFISFIYLGLLIVSCNKADFPDFPDKEQTPLEPKIDSITVNKLSFQVGESIFLYVHFTDGDGDIGYNEGDSMSLYIIDPRFPLTIERWVPPLRPIESKAIVIRGTLEVQINRMILSNPQNASEKFKFQIQLRDRSGKRSWLVDSPEIEIRA